MPIFKKKKEKKKKHIIYIIKSGQFRKDYYLKNTVKIK